MEYLSFKFDTCQVLGEPWCRCLHIVRNKEKYFILIANILQFSLAKVSKISIQMGNFDKMAIFLWNGSYASEMAHTKIYIYNGYLKIYTFPRFLKSILVLDNLDYMVIRPFFQEGFKFLGSFILGFEIQGGQFWACNFCM